MKLPISWLKKYIDIPWTPEKLAEALTLSGTKVDAIEKKSGEAVLEIEITTNRADCLSILGLAREISVLTGEKIKFPKISRPAVDNKNLSQKLPDIFIEDKQACMQYTARLISHVTIKSAPEEAQKCLEWMGARSIHNVVDATNFVLFEMGQPLHAFDYDKLAGGKIMVRRARSGEKFIGIDGIEYTLDDKTLVIADAEKPIAIAGVMGGKLTEVTESTKNILLESALFDPRLVRQASRKYKLFTESSYRFERGVNPDNVTRASSRTTDLILEWSGGISASLLLEKVPVKKETPKSILLQVSNVEAIVGMKITASRIASILKNLGFEVKPTSQNKLLVTPQAWRSDIFLEEDLAEEVLRIEGFDKVPARLPVTRYSGTWIQDMKATETLEIKKFLVNLGFNEIITFSLVSEKALTNSAFTKLREAQRIANPLSAEQEFLRPLLLPGMLQSILINVHRKAESLKFFEIGNRYVDENEETALALAFYGNFEENWHRKSAATFYDLKGVIENILGFLRVKAYEWNENQACQKYENSSTLKISGIKIGTLGLLNRNVLKNWDLTRPVIYAELVLDEILRNSSQNNILRVKALPKYPLVYRDIAFVIDEKISVQVLETAMRAAASPYLADVKLFDEYIGKNIAKGKRSLAFSLAYQKESGTFTDEEILVIQKKVGESLKNNYQVEFR